MACSAFVKGLCVPSIPGLPRIVKFIGKEVTVTWTEPDSDGGAEITGYLIAYTATDGSLAQHVSVGVTTTAKLNENLSGGTSYVFAVAAMNTTGCGDFSLYSEPFKIPKYAGNKIYVLYYCNMIILSFGNILYQYRLSLLQ